MSGSLVSSHRILTDVVGHADKIVRRKVHLPASIHDAPAICSVVTPDKAGTHKEHKVHRSNPNRNDTKVLV